ncbi:MAG: hypothetical protein KAJ55_07355 [Anaerolineales bacterium]|nr:hypothetical protein [Anaerolineales bacterium]
MFYTDEARKIAPVFYLALVCLVFWAAMFYAWPFWAGAFCAVAFGVLGSYLFGSWLRDRIQARIQIHDARTREAIQAQLDDDAQE